MLLGISNNLQDRNRIAIKKRIGLVTTVFLVCVFLPFVIYALFHFNIVPSKPIFGSDVQEPVAKVITGSGVGTAFLISPTTLLTARHVVENLNVGDQIDLIFEQTKNKYQTKGTIKFIAPTNVISSADGLVPMEYFLNDVAIIEVDEITDIEPLTLGESDVVNNLDEVILIGYPGGDYSITIGNINNTKFQGLDLFKLDATSNPGNSGGPCILKEDNIVIGILVGGSGPYVQGENVALKIENVKKILDKVKIVY
ncbi:serine protease [Draconibacterium sp.]|nr:serine protease [Draconibacterium sp.]